MGVLSWIRDQFSERLLETDQGKSLLIVVRSAIDCPRRASAAYRAVEYRAIGAIPFSVGALAKARVIAS